MKRVVRSKAKRVEGAREKEATKWGQTIIRNYVKADVQVENADWYRNGERKVLVVKMKSRGDKTEVVKREGI